MRGRAEKRGEGKKKEGEGKEKDKQVRGENVFKGVGEGFNSVLC